jgi:hypothetical protein
MSLSLDQVWSAKLGVPDFLCVCSSAGVLLCPVEGCDVVACEVCGNVAKVAVNHLLQMLQ